jgi:hypothetical protein
MKKNFCLVILFLIIFPVFFPNFGNCQTSTVNISVSATVAGEAPPPPPPPPGDGGGGGGGGEAYIHPGTKVILKGRAYPLCYLTILKNGATVAVFQAQESGLFEREISGIAGGMYTFGIWAEDTEGKKSVTLSFTIGAISGMTTTVSGIFLSPTIALTPTQVEKGKEIDFVGQTFPESQVKIFISSNEILKEVISTSKGKWSYKLNTTPLEEREHQVKAMSLYGAGEQSLFSQTLSFLVLKPGALVCRGADLNFDGKVNIFDFSILLYFWRQKNPSNTCADINHDGIVNIFDFSIMMYWWTN